jgi:hypothetical protein
MGHRVMGARQPCAYVAGRPSDTSSQIRSQDGWDPSRSGGRRPLTSARPRPGDLPGPAGIRSGARARVHDAGSSILHPGAVRAGFTHRETTVPGAPERAGRRTDSGGGDRPTGFSPGTGRAFSPGADVGGAAAPAMSSGPVGSSGSTQDPPPDGGREPGPGSATAPDWSTGRSGVRAWISASIWAPPTRW